MNPVQKLFELRDYFNDVAASKQEIVDKFTSMEGILPPSFSINLPDGGWMTYDQLSDTLTYYDKWRYPYYYPHFYQAVLDDPKILTGELWGDACPFTFSDVLDMLQDSTNYFSTLCAMTQLSLQRGYIKVEELEDIVRENATYSTDEIRQLLSNVRYMADTDGKVSPNAFINMVKAMADSNKAAVDNQTWVLDTSSPFAVRSFITTIGPQALATASAVLTMVGGATLKILGLVGMGVAAVWNLIASRTATELSINPEAVTDYVKGPILYEGGGMNPLGLSDVIGNRNLTLLHTVLGDVYCWANRSGGTFSANTFLRPIFSMDSVASVVAGCVNSNVDPHPAPQGQTWNRQKYMQPTEDQIFRCYLDDAEWTAVMADPVKLCRTLIVDHLFRDFLLVNVGTYWDNAIGNTITGWTGTDKDYVRFANALRFANMCYNGYFNESSIPSNVEWLQDMYQHCFARFLQNGLQNNVLQVALNPGTVIEIEYQIDTDTVRDTTFCGGFIVNPWRLVFKIAYQSADNMMVKLDNSRFGILHVYDADFIPEDRAITIPDFTPEQVIKAAVIAGLVIAAICVVGGVISRRLAARRALKQIGRLKNLNKLRDVYIADPTEENSRALSKAILAYNFRAKLFGWGSYDAANGWMNAATPVGGAILSSLNTGTLNDKIQSLSDDTEPSLTTITGLVNRVGGSIDPNWQ